MIAPGIPFAGAFEIGFDLVRRLGLGFGHGLFRTDGDDFGDHDKLRTLGGFALGGEDPAEDREILQERNTAGHADHIALLDTADDELGTFIGDHKAGSDFLALLDAGSAVGGVTDERAVGDVHVEHGGFRGDGRREAELESELVGSIGRHDIALVRRDVVALEFDLVAVFICDLAVVRVGLASERLSACFEHAALQAHAVAIGDGPVRAGEMHDVKRNGAGSGDLDGFFVLAEGSKLEILARDRIFKVDVLFNVFRRLGGFLPREEDLVRAFDLGGRTVEERDFTGVQDFSLALAGQEVDVLGVPLRIEVEILGVGPPALADQVGAVGREVLHEPSARAEKVDAVVVLPRLEVDAELGIVFGVELINGDLRANFGIRAVVFLQDGVDVLAGELGRIEDKQVQSGVAADEVVAADVLGLVVRHVGARGLDHVAEFFRGTVLGLVDVDGGAGNRGDARLVEHFNDAVDTLSFLGILEAVVFGGDHDDPGAVVVLDGLNSGVAVIDLAGLDHLAQIAADLVGIGILEDIGLRDDIRVGIIPDEVKHVGVIFDHDVQLHIDLGIVIIGGRFGCVDGVDGGNGADSRGGEFCNRFHSMFFPLSAVFHFSSFFASSSNSAITPGSTDSLILTGTARAVTK